MSEHTHPGPAQPRTADDLQKITGIGPVLAKRLREAGITSYQDLATIRAERIAELLGGGGGISVERITSQDWTGQAQRLAGSATANPPEHQRYATFHVELLIDSDGEVRRTKVRHYQTDSEDNWAGWDQEQLAAVIAGRAGLTFTQVSPGGSGTRNGSGRADVREPATGSGIIAWVSTSSEGRALPSAISATAHPRRRSAPDRGRFAAQLSEGKPAVPGPGDSKGRASRRNQPR
jgi:hypothetical protein